MSSPTGWSTTRMQRYEAILMPLSSDGDRVDMLLVGLVYDDGQR